MEAKPKESTDLYDYIAWVHLHRKNLTIAGVVILALMGGVWFVKWRKTEKQVQASRALFTLPSTLGSSAGSSPPSSSELLKVTEEHPGTLAAEHALLLAAGTFFSENRFPEAQQKFESFISTYPESPFLPQASFGVAASLDAQGKTDEAINRYQQVLTRHANESGVANAAKLSLAIKYETQKKPDQALKLYDELMRTRSMSISSEAMMRREKLLLAHPELGQTNALVVPSPDLSNLIKMAGTNLTFTNRPSVQQPNAPKPAPPK